jgi:hypothetical protein
LLSLNAILPSLGIGLNFFGRIRNRTLLAVLVLDKKVRQLDINGVMFGQPGNNEETLRDSINLVKDISYGEYRAFKIFGCLPFPGTGLYDW